MDYRNDDERRYESYVPSDAELRRSRSVNRVGSSERIKKRLKKKAKKQKRRTIMHRLGIGALICAMLLIVVGTGIGIGMYTAVSTEIHDMNINELALNHASYIMYTDDAGNEVQLEQIKTSVNREWVASEDISDNLKNAAVAIEDQRFYKHHGVDIKRTMGATVKFVLSKIGIGDSSYGGSTITQQVIKNITNETDKSATRKVKEMMRAIAIEKQLEKDEILTMYLNIAFFANNCYGVEAAAKMYFGKSADEVNIQEAATIVGITQYPTRFDPYANPDNAIEKRNRVIGKMLELGMITEEEHDKAVKSSLKLVGKKGSGSGKVSSYFVDQVTSDVIADLQAKKGYSKDFAEQQLTNGGLKIYSTVDPKIQKIMENVFEDTANFPNSSAESAMVIIDPYTGAVKGMVGGLGAKTDVRGFNRATQAKRQPGSAIKPLSVYAPALELGKINQSSVITDEKITIGSDDWEPSNSYKGFKGNMLVHEAVGRSSNIPAVKVLDMIGINKSFSYLENNFKLSTLQSADKNYSSLALGGLTTGVTVKEMAAAYSIFVNNGRYIKPYTYTKVVDSSGNVVLENNISPVQTLKESTAYIMSDFLLEPVNGGYGTARSAKLSSITTYGKTGTTNDNYDKWFVGYTPYYVGAVWYGYDKPKSVGGSNPCTTVWKKVMEEVHSGLSEKELPIPDDVVSVEVCKNSGNVAKSSCSSIIGFYEKGKQPKRTCFKHSYKSYNSAEKTESPEGLEVPYETERAEGTEESEESEETDFYDESDPPVTVEAPEKTSEPERVEAPVKTKSPSSATSVPSKEE